MAGLTIPCELRYAETANYFPAPDPASPRAAGASVRLTREDWKFNLGNGIVESPFSEYSILTAPFSDALMEYDRMIFHAVAVRWRDRAYLICAPSGVGKSTQARFLQELRPGEFSVICGDRPVLEFCQSAPCRDGTLPSAASPQIIVHPSPWNGKENWRGAEAAPLAGLILLRRGDENALSALTPREAAFQCYAQVIQTAITEKTVIKAAELTTILLNSVPVWQLTTHQVPDSTRLLLETVFII